MAGNWIKFDTSTSDKPEVWAIAESLGIDPDAVVGKLLRVWAWFDDHSEDGEAAGGSMALLDRRVGVEGFCRAMCQVAWMRQDGDIVRIANFDRHNGQTAKKRANTAKRVASFKANSGNAGGNAKGNAGGNATDTQLSVTARELIPRPIRRLVYDRDGRTCAYCGRKEGETEPREPKIAGSLAIDHVIPLARGGENTEKNMVTSCVPCNQYKSDRTPDECGLAWPTVNGERLGVTKSVTKSVTRALPKEEKRREEKKDTHTHTAKPEPIQPPDELTHHWDRWCEYCLAIGKPVNQIQADAILMDLGRRGTAKAIRDIDFSIRKSAKSILDSDNDFEKHATKPRTFTPATKTRNYT
jgi:5-methylcytosine-specific restriction endonuclease McrA